MQLGMIGLGRMGATMVRRLLQGGQQCVVFDRSPTAVEELTQEKAIGASSLADLALEPGVGDISRTPGREKVKGTAEEGYLHCGPSGAGHFVKMVHNGIEYGLMAAYAEGMNILAHANVGKNEQSHDVETTPLRNPEEFPFDLNLPDIAEVWRRGSVIASWLLDLTASALLKDPKLAKFEGRVSDSGEGRWTIKAAIDEGVPAPVLSTALYSRFSSRGEAEFGDKLLSAMRFEFGGHHEKSASK